MYLTMERPRFGKSSFRSFRTITALKERSKLL